MATYDLASQTIGKIKTGDVIDCSYCGAGKSVTLPKGVYTLQVWGAQGGYRSTSTYGGMGGYSIGTLTIETDTVIYMYSGGSGNTGGTSGGFNGGGSRASYAGGGGGSDIRIGTDSLYARVIVAGGGGSCGASAKQGGYGGGESGQTRSDFFGSGGGGGTQTAGGSGTSSGSFGSGGYGYYFSSGYAGAGGGGWYGGGGSYPDGSGDDDRGGGGGSGYVYTSSTYSNYPSGCLLNSSYYLSDASTINGGTSFSSPTGTSETGHAGDGYCRITAVDVNSTENFVKIDGAWKTVSTIYMKYNGEWIS